MPNQLILMVQCKLKGSFTDDTRDDLDYTKTCHE